MKASPLWSALFFASLASVSIAADETSPVKPAEPAAAPKQASEEAIRARLMEHTKIKAAVRAPAQPQTPAAAATTNPVKSEPATTTVSPTSTAAEKPAAATAKAKDEPASTLPKVEVNKPRITVLDHQLAEQDKEIAREKKLTKSTDLDRALNGPKVSVPILGNESTKYRTAMASERVSLMESEKDIIEAIAHAKTKEEKAELQKELNEIKALRRDLEKSIR